LIELENGNVVEADHSAHPARTGCCSESKGTSTSLIGVVAPHNGQTWFFKMLGDPKTVAREKDAFVKFVRSVKLPNDS
jgi:hypothetical protein